MSNAPKAGMSIDPDMLAAYIDKRLSPEQRAAVEAQLAADPDSYAVLVETMKALDSMPAAASPATSRRPWLLAVGLAAAAAALVLGVWIAPGILQRLRGSEPGVAKLVAAAGEERYVEARLTGGFKFGPLKSVTRGAAETTRQNLALVAAAGELQQQAQSNPSGTNLHAWGVAQLLLRDFDGAVESLEAASLEDPQSAAVLTDLAAAYLTRFQVMANAEDLPKALETIERARQAERAPVEALFTRALVLELMHLDDMAIAAWREYLEKDAASGWAQEARNHLSRLAASTPISRWEQLERDLEAAASSPAVEQDIVREFPEEVPDVLFGVVFGRWADAVVGGGGIHGARQGDPRTRQRSLFTGCSAVARGS